MRRWDRIVLLAGLVALAPVLAGCENFDMDKLDVFHLNDKKKLPGERKDLFPSGVPGVTQGIPPEYLKGNQPPPDTALALPANPPAAGEPNNNAAAGEKPSKTAAVAPLQTAPEPTAEPKPKPKQKAKVKPKPKPATAATTGQPAAQQPPQAPWPAAPPAQQQAQPAQSSPWNTGQSATAPWPSAPPPGTFSR
jgi:hypothetical protein